MKVRNDDKNNNDRKIIYHIKVYKIKRIKDLLVKKKNKR